MAKRNETIEIEKALANITREKGIYGCEEITIGFVNGGHGNEIVDFMTMDSKGIIRCYEIKVTLQDLKSKARKSWYGNFNYLVVSGELQSKVNDWTEYLPDGVGLLMGYEKKGLPTWELQSIFKSKKQHISNEVSEMLKESMVRSMYYKMLKYMDSQSIEKMKELQKGKRYWEKLYREEHQDYLELYRKIKKYERLKKKNEGKFISIDDLIEEEQEKAGTQEEILF